MGKTYKAKRVSCGIIHPCVYLQRTLNQKQYIFAFQIAPTTAVKLFDSIALDRIREGQFLNANVGRTSMQINNATLKMLTTVIIEKLKS